MTDLKDSLLVGGVELGCRLFTGTGKYGDDALIPGIVAASGCEVVTVPGRTPAAEILALHPDGIMLSNGPGDPAENVFCIEQLKKLLGKVPMFGICLGHQLMALANGGKTYKLKYGHRGVNQPVKEVGGQGTYITSQNHGYAVDAESIRYGRIRFVNANDRTCLFGAVPPGGLFGSQGYILFV